MTGPGSVAPPRAAVFDLDGTLLTSEARNRVVWERFLARYGIEADDALIARVTGRRGRDVLAEHAHLFSPPSGDAAGPDHLADRLTAELVAIDAEVTGPAPEPVPGAVELVRALSDAGVSLGLVTSAHRSYADMWLAEIGLSGTFDVEVTAELVAVGKPDPAGFTLACARLGVAPGTTVGFEDSPAGVAAIKAAGMWCVGLSTSRPPAELAGADLVVPDLAGLPWPPPVGPWARSTASAAPPAGAETTAQAGRDGVDDG